MDTRSTFLSTEGYVFYFNLLYNGIKQLANNLYIEAQPKA